MVKAMLTKFMAIYPAGSTAENGHLCTSFGFGGLLRDLKIREIYFLEFCNLECSI